MKAQGKDKLPLYQMLREPTHLADIDWKMCWMIAIWCINGSIICFDEVEPHDNSFVVSIQNEYYRYCAIHGENEASVLETITFLLSLKQLEEKQD